MTDVFDQILKLKNRSFMLEPFWALERLLGRDYPIVPYGCVTVGPVDVPDIFQECERLEFGFGREEREEMPFIAQDVVISIHTARATAGDPLCKLAFGQTYHSHGDAYHPIRAMVLGRPVSVWDGIDHDGALYQYLAGVDKRAAFLFSRMWRLQQGVMMIDRSGQVAGQVYS